MSAKGKLKKKIREEATSRQASETQERQTAIRARLEKARANLASGVGLENDAVIGRHVAPSIIVTGHIAGQAVETSKLADVAATTAKIGGLSVTTEKLDNLSVITAKINNGAVDTARIAGSAVVTDRINNNAVIGAKIDALAVDSGKLGELAVVTAKINNNAVVGAKIDALAVDSGKIADLAITTVKLNSLAVDTAKLASGSVTGLKVASNAINTSELATSAVTETILATNAVTGAKIDNSLNNPGDGVFGLRTIGLGSGPGAAGANHSHSTSTSLRFEAVPDGPRLRMLQARGIVRDAYFARAAMSAAELQAQRLLLLGIFHICFDGITETAGERYQRRQSNPAFDNYLKRKFLEMYTAEIQEGTTTREAESTPVSSASSPEAQDLVDAGTAPRFVREVHPDLVQAS